MGLFDFALRTPEPKPTIKQPLLPKHKFTENKRFARHANRKEPKAILIKGWYGL